MTAKNDPPQRPHRTHRYGLLSAASIRLVGALLASPYTSPSPFRVRPVVKILLALALVLIAVAPAMTTRAQPGDTGDPVQAIIASLTPEERVGQLMLVTFEGSNLGPETAIAQLIREYNVGGVVLLADNDNINGQVNTPRLVQSLTTDLQQLAYDSAQATTPPDDATPTALTRRDEARAFIPLFVATQHAGNGQPGTQIALGTTPLPSLMALGATWNQAYVEQVGEIAGIELSTMGVNMLLGPALDVAQQPQAERTLDLGVDTFGGEPYWVGRMGQAYVTGVHEGSAGRIAVIAQHFPGLGLADTQPDQEIPVVPRSVDALRVFDLVPYHAVTGDAEDALARADGMQCANLRYQGETIRSITRPVCVDEQAADQLLSLDYFRTWRDDGIMISSPLGTHAIRRYYDVTPFPHRQVAREAFLAGNDLLYLSTFGAQPGDAQLANVIDVIKFFAEQYEADPVFRARVDTSLARILRLKLRLYDDDLSLPNVVTPANDIDRVGSFMAPLYTIAEHSVTLLAPRRESLPPPPARNENIVIFTDVRLVQQCSYCATYPPVTVNALEVAIERRYGPFADAQIRPEQVVSFSFGQLQSYLRGDVTETTSDTSLLKTNQRIGEALREVDWIVFVMLDVSPSVETSSIVRHLLETESNIVDSARVVVIALGAPIYLSSTEISKFAAYYGLFSSTPPYIDAAARALFQEINFPGALPLSLPAVGYDIVERTAPDPSQTIQLEAESLAGQPVDPSPAGPDILTVQPGQQLILRTRPILDRNGHMVPDGTPVEFILTFVTDNLQTRQNGVTEDGIARTMFRPTRPGRVQVNATSVNTTRSATFQVNVTGGDTTADSTPTDGGTAAPDAVPVDQPTAPTPVAAAGAEMEIEITAQPGGGSPDGPALSSSPTSKTAVVGRHRRLNLAVFALCLLVLSTVSVGGYYAGRAITFTRNGGIRVVLGGVVAGLTGYIYYGVGGPGMTTLYDQLGTLAPVANTLGSALVGLGYTWWMLRRDRQLG